ncbi:MAG: hypothetical protein H7196_01020, partial [candidate division SR1 bacterium]|nr:hypothetical protein [candidate division SR1 bacterium]
DEDITGLNGRTIFDRYYATRRQSCDNGFRYYITDQNNHVSSSLVCFDIVAVTGGSSNSLACSQLSGSSAAVSTSSTTSSSICIAAGQITLYPGDSNSNNDTCSNSDIAYTLANPTTPVIQDGVTCNRSENSVALGSISTAPIRQNPTTTISDILFDDLRGLSSSSYTITAEISNFTESTDPSKIIGLGSNPDNAQAILDLGIVSSISVANGGSGYTQAPAIAFVGGGGSGASATTAVSNGIVTKIDVKSYGRGYTSAPTLVIVPTNGGSGASATAKIIEAGSNLNPETANPEANVFVTLDPSIGTISKIKPTPMSNPSNFSTGPRSLVTSPTIQHTLFTTSAAISTGRYDLDNTLFGLRVPAYLQTGDYRSTITQTIVVG